MNVMVIVTKLVRCWNIVVNYSHTFMYLSQNHTDPVSLYPRLFYERHNTRRLDLIGEWCASGNLKNVIWRFLRVEEEMLVIVALDRQKRLALLIGQWGDNGLRTQTVFPI